MTARAETLLYDLSEGKGAKTGVAARETIVLDRWHRGWSRYNFPASLLLPRLVEEHQALEAAGLEFRPDGSIYWRRDQFIVPVNGAATSLNLSTKMPMVLFEYTGEGYNQLLMLCTDGHLYKLETDWDGATVAQVADGYQFSFAAATWSDEKSGLDVDAKYGLAASREILLVSHPDQATKRWEGTDLVDVGLAAPTAALAADPFGTGTDQDLTTYTETDPNARLTVAAGPPTRVTAAALTNNEDARVWEDRGVGSELDDFKAEFTLRVTAASDAATNYLFVAASGGTDLLTMESGAAYNMDYLRVTYTGGALVMRIGTNIGMTTGGTTLSFGVLNTTYYVRFIRLEQNFTLQIYSDASFSTLVASKTMSGAYAEPGRYIYAMGTYNSTAATTMSFYVEDLSISELDTYDGPLSAGTYSYYYTYESASNEFESMPSDTLDVHISSDNAPASIPLMNFPNTSGGVSQTKHLYRAFTSDDSEDARGADFHWVAEIAAATMTYLDDTLPAELGETIAFDHALPPRGELLAWHQDRMYMAGLSCASRSYDDYATTGLGNMLTYSYLDEPYYWPGANEIRVGDDSDIVDLHSWRHFLIVFKEHAVWTLTGYDPDSDFTLTQIEPRIGLANKGAVASGPSGVVWKSAQGIMFWNGATIRMIYDYRFLPTAPALTEAYPTVAFHRNRFYILQGAYLLIWDPQDDTWTQLPVDIDCLGLWPFEFARNQSHILTAMHWRTGEAAGTIGQLTALHTNRGFTHYDDEGSSYSDLYAPVDVTLPPLIAPPGEVIVPLEVSIDGSWTDLAGGDGTKDVKMYVNSSANYSDNAWATTPDAPQGGNVIGVPGGVAANTIYIQLKGEYAKDFLLHAVRVTFMRMSARGA